MKNPTIRFLNVLKIVSLIITRVDIIKSSNSSLPLTLIVNLSIQRCFPPTSMEGEWREEKKDVILGSIKFHAYYQPVPTIMLCGVGVLIWNSSNTKEVDPDDENCNYPIKFKTEDPLKCAYEPRPFITTLTKKVGPYQSESIAIHCGPHQRGKMYSFAYKICITEYPIRNENINGVSFPNSIPHTHKHTIDFEVFRFCYDDNTKQILHTEHEIMTPLLLFDKRLQREKEVVYETMLDDRNFFMVDFQKLKDKYANIKEDASSTNLSAHVEKFESQKLAPTEDFALALWRKTTYHILNLKKMRTDLVELWDHICQKIRESAFKIETEKKGIKFYIHTGAYQIIQGELGIIQSKSGIPDLWSKKIYYCLREPREDDAARCEAISIYMDQNFDGDSAIDPSIVNCEKNLCENAFTKRFPAVSESIRCCSMSNDYENEKNFILIRKVMETNFLYDDKLMNI